MNGDFVSFNTRLSELTKYSKLYVNESKTYYNSFNNMNNLKSISYEDLQNYKNKTVIYHSN